MASDGNKQLRPPSALPPRTLNVQKFAESRASELETLYSVVAQRQNNDFRSQRNKRRRTTGFDNRITKNRHRKRQKTELKVNNVKSCGDDTKEVPRRIRRRIELKKNPQTGFCTSGDGTKRLRTHIWHAKRFKMTKLWGFYLPLGLQGRGRGSRALLKHLNHRVLVHDASYYSAVQLEGPQDLLLSILGLVLVPSPSDHDNVFSQNVLSGVVYGKAMLHYIGAPHSRAIAPVTCMWQPVCQQPVVVGLEGHYSDTQDEPQSIGSFGTSRKVWVWLHAAAFTEGYDAVKSACEKQIGMTGSLVSCISLEGQLSKLEVLGSRALQLLRKILNPVPCTYENSWQMKKFSSMEADTEAELEISSIPKNEDQVPFCAVISLAVNDPRALSKKGMAVVCEAPSAGILDHIKEDDVHEHSTLLASLEKANELSTASCLKSGESSDMVDCVNLWDVSKGVSPPVEESVVCMEKHHQRMAFFCAEDSSPGEVNTSVKGFCSSCCPILLLRNDNLRGQITSWSIVLPTSWVKTFWIPIISCGAHAIGLREKHWIACEIGLPYFPSDFPDCNAYSCFMDTQAAASDANAQLRPSSMRPLRVFGPSVWDIVKFARGRTINGVEDTEVCPHELCAKNTISDNLQMPSDCGNCEMAAVDTSCEWFVARTSLGLADMLNNIIGDHILLFPRGKKCIAKFLKNKIVVSPSSNKVFSQATFHRRPCFLRVLLYAFKEGVFEEEAVVYAPHISDIKLWTSRSDNNGGELQVPKDLMANHCHRQPIGFVTTGFVRGSKKPVAVALCEVFSLAHLREEQWASVSLKRRRKEIYVLVRNLRSTAYRLARATIVLEQQEADVAHM